MLIGLVLRRQMDGSDGQGPDRCGRTPKSIHQLHGALGQIPDQVGGVGELFLPGQVPELRRAQSHLNAAGIQSQMAQPGGHGIGEHGNAGLELNTGGQVLWKSSAVAHGFDRLGLIPGPDRISVQAVGILIELAAQLSHQSLQHLPAAGGQLARWW